MNFAITLTAALALSATGAWADDQAKRAGLAGSWEIEDAKEAASVWTFEDKGETIHVTHSEGDRKVVDFECNTMGRDCNVKEDGKKVTVSFWYNGPHLVQLETRGSRIVKRRFQANGDTLQVETIPVTPMGDAETQRFKRMPDAARQR